LLDIIAEVLNATKDINQGRIILSIDNKKVVDGVNNEIFKANGFVQDARSLIAQLKPLIKKATT